MILIIRIVRFMILGSLVFSMPLSARGWVDPRTYFIRYCQFINQHAYRQAVRLLGVDGSIGVGISHSAKDIDQEAAELRRRFAGVKSFSITVGESTEDQSMGGRASATMPVHITLRMKSGRIRKIKGIVELMGQGPGAGYEGNADEYIWAWWISGDTTKTFTDHQPY